MASNVMGSENPASMGEDAARLLNSQITRRGFLRQAGALAAGAVLTPGVLRPDEPPPESVLSNSEVDGHLFEAASKCEYGVRPALDLVVKGDSLTELVDERGRSAFIPKQWGIKIRNPRRVQWSGIVYPGHRDTLPMDVPNPKAFIIGVDGEFHPIASGGVKYKVPPTVGFFMVVRLSHGGPHRGTYRYYRFFDQLDLGPDGVWNLDPLGRRTTVEATQSGLTFGYGSHYIEASVGGNGSPYNMESRLSEISQWVASTKSMVRNILGYNNNNDNNLLYGGAALREHFNRLTQEGMSESELVARTKLSIQRSEAGLDSHREIGERSRLAVGNHKIAAVEAVLSFPNPTTPGKITSIPVVVIHSPNDLSMYNQVNLITAESIVNLQGGSNNPQHVSIDDLARGTVELLEERGLNDAHFQLEAHLPGGRRTKINLPKR